MNPNDPAVFTLEVDAKGGFLLTKGLTKRELFTAMAMQGLISHHSFVNANQFYAEMAVRIADALIAELSKEVAK